MKTHKGSIKTRLGRMAGEDFVLEVIAKLSPDQREN